MHARIPLTDRQSEIAVRYIPMARAVSRPFKTSWPNVRDEFESAAMMALVEAAQSFDPSRKIKFSTFARYRIWGAMRDVQRRLYSYGVPNGDDEHHLTTLSPYSEQYGSILNTNEDLHVGHELEYIEYVESLIKKLPRSHQESFRLIHIVGLTHEDTSIALGLSHSRVGYMHRESFAILNGTWAGTFGRAIDAKRYARLEKEKSKYVNVRIYIGLPEPALDAQFSHQVSRLRPSMELAQVVYRHRPGAFGRMRRA